MSKKYERHTKREARTGLRPSRLLLRRAPAVDLSLPVCRLLVSGRLPGLASNAWLRRSASPARQPSYGVLSGAGPWGHSTLSPRPPPPILGAWGSRRFAVPMQTIASLFSHCTAAPAPVGVASVCLPGSCQGYAKKKYFLASSAVLRG